jgi:hypothetical protein
MKGGDSLKIVEVKHQFTRTPPRRTVTEGIVIHHSASGDISSQTIHEWHLRREWIGIGYHFVVRIDGTIETGRPLEAVGTHAMSPANERTIGICVVGNFESHHPTPRQIDSLVWLINEHIKPRYGTLPITGHREHRPTACPGKYFPMVEVIARTKGAGLIVNNRKVAAPVKLAGGRTYVQLEGESGRVWVQLRALADLLGASLAWDQQTETARLTIK